jgi:two-component system cell cycle sensor histidine kinase/response regulator CckA
LHRRTILSFQMVVMALALGLISAGVNAANLSRPPHRILKSASELDYPPFALVRADGSADGFSVDLLKAVTQAVGLEVNFAVGPWHEIKQKLADGQLDVLPLVSYSQERESVFDFTAPYLRMHGTIFVRKGEKSIRGKADLKDKEVMVMRGDTAHEYAVSENLSNKLVLTDNFEEAMKLLSEGKHDAVIIQQLIGFQLITKLGITNVVNVTTFEENTLKPVDKPLSGFEQKFCIAVQDGDRELLALLNEGLAIVIADGAYGELYNKWFGPILPQPPVPFSLILKYVLFILGPILFLLAITGLWYLKREVANKTQSLREEIDERKRAEEALQENEAIFSAFLEHSPIYVFFKDKNIRALRLSKNYEQMLGVPLREAIGKTMEELFPSDLSKSMVADDLRVLNECQRVNVVEELSGRIYETTKFPVLKDGAPFVLAGFTVDITERKRAEDALRESEEKYRLAFRTSPDAINLNGTSDGKYIDINEGFTKITGYSRDDCIGKSAVELNIWDDPKHRKRLVAALRTKGFVENMEARFRKKDGTILIGLMSARLLEINQESVILSITRDISAYKQTAEALRESEKKFRNFAEQSLVGIYLLQDGVFKYVNPKFAEIFGYTVEECLDNMHFRNLVHPGDLATVEEQVRRRVSGETRTVQYAFKGVKKGGEIVHVEIFGSSIPFEGSMVATGTMLDITERKRAEEEREKLQAQLSQAQKMESVGRLAGGVAHDFNNKLGIIIGNVEMAMMDLEPEDPIRQELQQIMNAAQHSAALVRQLLGFARKQAVSPKVLELNVTVSGMLQMLRRLIGEDIDLAWIPGRDLWKVKIDPSQIDQILANLAVNARDAISGVGKVTIETQNATLDEAYCAVHDGFVPGQYALLALSDDGVGMSKEVLEHLFEPFFTTKEVGRGTGLGLSTTYGIVKQNDGFINVYSESGKGTTVKIYLPRFESEGIAVNEGAKQQTPQGGTETVLLVEDEEGVLMVGKTMLERLGYTVLAASTPSEAIRLAGEHVDVIRLVLTDVVMPEMNGKELAEKLRSIHPSLKCLYMSGYTAEVIAHHGVLDKGVSMIQKPFSLGDLAAKVRDALDTA